jgi:S-adenosylmethionine/arginine decarboxylase-like enzyme
MTEYSVKEIGHQWIVYADRLSIASCGDEASAALKLIAEDSAANRATRKSAVRGIRASKQNPPA